MGVLRKCWVEFLRDEPEGIGERSGKAGWQQR